MNITIARKIINCEQCALLTGSIGERRCEIMARDIVRKPSGGIPPWCPLPPAHEEPMTAVQKPAPDDAGRKEEGE